MGIKLAWYFVFFVVVVGGWGAAGSFKDNDPSTSIFNTLHSLLPVVLGLFFSPLGLVGVGWGGLSRGTALSILSDTTEKARCDG